MNGSDLKKLVAEARPIIERMIDDTARLNRMFLAAWERGQLDALWAHHRKPGLYLHYFIRARGLGDIKIGKTNNIRERFDAIQTHCSRGADLIACYPLGVQHETELHRDFAHCRLNGEWFYPHSDLLDFLQSIGSPTEFTNEPATRFQERKRKLLS